jgi:hypothetical protein
MRIISIDVGIKNLAYCILDSVDKNKNNYKIISWDVINLCGSDHLCNCSLKPKVIKEKKKKVKELIVEPLLIEPLLIEPHIILCNKKASFIKIKDGISNYYCQTHAKLSEFILPNKSLKNIKSWKRDALLCYAKSQGILYEESDKKDILIKNINEFLKDKVLENISTVSANDMTLVQMGITLVKEFDKILDLEHIDQIVIENQISPIANRMKTLQGMIAQYFIMRDKSTISFISSANKLKIFSKENNDSNITISAEPSNHEPSNYGERKKQGIKIVKELLEKNDINNEWLEVFLNHKKKDDMADSFLQGAWFLSK